MFFQGILLVLLAAECYSQSDDLNYRLVNGPSNDVGRIEVRYSGLWGTVCDDFFDDKDASVACYSLGFGRTGRTLGNLYGPGTGSIWLDDLDCTGYENSLGECRHRGWGVHNCNHNEDVSISCQDTTGNNTDSSASPEISATTAWPTSAATSDYSDLPLACRASYRPEVINNSSGYITSPNFPYYYYNYLDCQWLISSALSYEVVSLRFNYFYLYWDSEYVYIYDGSSESSRLIASLTGSPSDVYYTVFTTTQPNMLLKFTSYYRDPYFGFEAFYWTTQGGTVSEEARVTTSDYKPSTAYPVDVPLACKASYRPEVINNSTGWITSPYYPWSYYNNLDCQWLIASMFYEVVHIYFTDFATEECCDYVSIHDGDNVSAPVIVTLRGFPPLYRVYSTTQPNMLVRFITDSSVVNNGFYAVFYTVGSQTTAASDSSTTTTWYTTAALTTSQPSAPVIDPRPYVAVKLNGTMTATGSITQSCSDAFSADFRNSFQEVVGRANNLVATGQLCSDGGGPLRIVAGQIQSLFIGTAGQTIFSILVGPNPPDWVTLQTDESCSWQVSDFVRNGNNWRQPIISNIFGCPTITVDTNSFTWQQSFWDVF